MKEFKRSAAAVKDGQIVISLIYLEMKLGALNVTKSILSGVETEDEEKEEEDKNVNTGGWWVGNEMPLKKRISQISDHNN